MAQTGRWLGGAGVAIGTVAWTVWLTGRLAHANAHPLWVAVFATEVLAVTTGVVVAAMAARRPLPQALTPDSDAWSERHHRRDPDRCPTAVTALVGCAIEPDLRAAVRGAWRPAFSPSTPIADRAVALVHFEGTRRLIAIVALSLSLLAGVAPLAVPAPWMLAAGFSGLVFTSLGSMLLTGGRIRPGDRLRWSFASIGLVVGPLERKDSMPVRWAGVMLTIVALNLVIALRGMSDRWTHGLPPMADADRVTAMAAALALVAGGLATLWNLQPPEPGHFRASRRVEERSAREAALGATVIAGLLGLLAGILPGSVGAADVGPTEREHPTSVQPVVVEMDPDSTEVANRFVDVSVVTTERTDQARMGDRDG
jgi:hypothetical protein